MNGPTEGRTNTTWNDARTSIAFCVAPLAVPIVAALYLGWSPDSLIYGLVLVGSLFIAYVGTFLLGLPIYRILVARKLTAFWLAPVVGSIVGTTVLLVFQAVTLSAPDIEGVALKFGGSLGAVVGTIIWLIARPDRQAR